MFTSQRSPQIQKLLDEKQFRSVSVGAAAGKKARDELSELIVFVKSEDESTNNSKVFS